MIFVEDKSPNALDKLIKDNEMNDLFKALKLLSSKESEIINLRYGLNHQKPLTQKQIASRLNISRSYVSRIEKRALMKLYYSLTNK
ncbi:MAG: sigma-70 family RNA polymerase sigma factor [Clostridium sp.]|nr:MAG: sigma-70 family RNA polymerase sigma factor [Clostridium sp.]